MRGRHALAGCAITSLNFNSAKVQTAHAKNNSILVWNVVAVLHPLAQIIYATNLKDMKHV